MAEKLKKEITLYEILLRFNEDGFVGGHAIDMKKIIDGDDVIKREQPARPITVEDAAQYIGEREATLVAAVDEARAVALTATAEAEKEKERAEGLETQLTEAREREAGLRAQIKEIKEGAAALASAIEKI